MTYYTLGRTGLRISRFALGTMTFGTDWGWGADKQTARRLVDTYLDWGGNLFDTADLYVNGISETWLGEFIADKRMRDRAVIASKFAYSAEPGNPNAGGNGRKNILRAVEGSMKRLRTDYIDIYFLHAWDRLTPTEEVMRTLDDLVRAGKIRHFGLSNVPAFYAARAQTIAEARGYEPVAALQMEYSLAERSIENEYVPLGREHGMGIMAWGPLASGLLSGKYRPGKDAIDGSGRLAMMKDSGNPAFEKFTDRNWAIAAELEKTAAELGRGMAEVALNWVANRPGVASVLIGATKPAQLQANLGALDFSIPAELRARLDAASEPAPAYPYTFFGPQLQGMVHGAPVGSKPQTYSREIEIAAAATSAAAG